jgi:hypothetical protein
MPPFPFPLSNFSEPDANKNYHNLEIRSGLISPLLSNHRRHDNRIRQVLEGSGFDDQLATRALMSIFGSRHFSKNRSSGIVNEFRSVPMIPLTVSNERRGVTALIVMNMLETRTRIGDEEIGRARVRAAHARLGNDRAVFVAAVDFNGRIIEDVEVVEDFVRVGVAGESVQPVTTNAFIADNFESQIAVGAGGGGSRGREAHV